MSIEESTVPTGAACGSVYLDQGFENLIRKKLGTKADSIITLNIASELNKQFDSIKRNFDPYDPDCESVYEIPMRNAPEMPNIGLEEGYLKLSEYQTLFTSQLLNSQQRNPKRV